MKNLMVKFSSKCDGLSQRLAMVGDTGLPACCGTPLKICLELCVPLAFIPPQGQRQAVASQMENCISLPFKALFSSFLLFYRAADLQAKEHVSRGCACHRCLWGRCRFQSWSC